MDSVWKRFASGTQSMSKNLFLFMVCFWTVIGLGVSATGAYLSLSFEPNLLSMLLVLVVALVGVFVAAKSENPVFSLVGYMMVAAPFGLLLGPVVNLYTDASLVKVIVITAGVTIVLGIVGAVIPDSLEGWGGWLLGGITVLLLGYLIVPIASLFGLPIAGALTILDWVGVVLFSGYIIYDLNRAVRVERTADNAIDCALSIYLDIINLFIRLLSLTGKKK